MRVDKFRGRDLGAEDAEASYEWRPMSGVPSLERIEDFRGD